MEYEWDEAKRLNNIEIHGYDFADAHKVFESDANISVVFEDIRKDYGEARYTLLAYFATRLTVIVRTLRATERIRIISFRNANSREVKLYEQEIKPSR